MPNLLTAERLGRKRDMLRVLRERRVAAWENDPGRWVQDVIGDILVDYQGEELRILAEDRNVAVRGPRGCGKTMPAAVAVLWFATTRELMGVDWKAPTTAGVWRHLEKFTWPEIHKWVRRIDWDALGLPRWRKGRELLTMSIQGQFGEAFAINSDDPANIEGAHASHMLLVVDEAKSTPDGSWDALEGYFSSPGEHYRFALSTPGAPLGRFYDIHAQKPGYQNWTPMWIRIDDAIRAGRVTEQWVGQMGLQWGEKSSLYRMHVLAEFAGEQDGVIPLAWIEDAMARPFDGSKITLVSADIADQGEDKTVLAYRGGMGIERVERPPAQELMRTAEMVAHRTPRGGHAVVDGIGIGAGVVSRLRDLAADGKFHVLPFIASERTPRMDASGVFGFTNKRSAAWWAMRELLDPENGYEVSLPDDAELKGDLAAPGWREVAGGKIQVESKDEIRKRLGRSTDVGDAVVMAFWQDAPQVKRKRLDGWVPERGRSKWTP